MREMTGLHVVIGVDKEFVTYLVYDDILDGRSREFAIRREDFDHYYPLPQEVQLVFVETDRDLYHICHLDGKVEVVKHPESNPITAALLNYRDQLKVDEIALTAVGRGLIRNLNELNAFAEARQLRVPPGRRVRDMLPISFRPRKS